jgi:cytochrome c peroxidase
MKNKIIILSVISFVIFGCSKLKLDGELEQKTIDFTVYEYPLVNDEMATLGKFLFYDENLSINNRITCGSCHIQKLGFADGLNKSLGFSDKETDFHTMAIANNNVFDRFFWDGRVNTLDNAVVMPISDHIEMGLDDEKLLLEKIKSIPYYQDLHKKAFGNLPMNKSTISSALTQFVRSLRVENSKNQKVLQGLEKFSVSEKRGRDLFFEKYDCGNCHNVDHTSGGTSWGGSGSNSALFNIGLDNSPNDWNQVSKAPNLANIGVTAPYMHDGRFKTLEEVIDHYSTGIQDNRFLSHFLKDDFGNAKKFNITDFEKQDLIAFLNTLTDYEFLNDTRYSNPFYSK